MFAKFELRENGYLLTYLFANVELRENGDLLTYDLSLWDRNSPGTDSIHFLI